MEPIYISEDSQRADGLTKILSGKSLSDSQESLNFLPSTPLTIGHAGRESVNSAE